jgi:cell wall-associated NlpC family hydrolase
MLGVLFALMLAFVTMGTPKASALNTGTAYTTTSLNLRSGPSTNYYIKRTMAYNSKVAVHSYAGNGWWNVTHNWSGVRGYAYGAYLRNSSGSYSTSSTSTSSSSTGTALANTAKQYVGYRYAYYGNTPSEGFSCVGLTQWVYKQNGIYVPESLGGQASSGSSVSRGNLQPGDIVLFQNTWWNGLSHAGVYVGNGWMVNASTPSSGVRWDNIYNSYYSGKWYDGRRVR